jgi:hypothetical protein
MQGENIFVFVVCGAREHIEALHFSLAALRRYSRHRILVVTDASRNEIPVIHGEVINISTPEAFNHHQASIYLKTGLNKFLPAGNNYCYLDTDVVALDNEVDGIFDHYQSPITFCSDHCVIEEFSPSAINCGCLEAFREDSPKPYYYYHDFHDNVLPKLLYIDKCISEIEQLVAESKTSALIYQWHKLKYSLPGRFYHLNSRYKMNKAEGKWYDDKGTLLAYPEGAKDDIKYVAEKTGFRYDYKTKQWSRPDGTSLTVLSCTHLLDALAQKFDVHVSAGWRHWNGGVFLFRDDSSAFLNFWHHATMEIFRDKAWKTRDQGTLAATVWHFGLQEQPTLPLEYNLIADYNNKDIMYDGGLTFSVGSSHKKVKPHFVHVYHHWGDTSWQVWNDVVKHTAQ